MSGYWNGDEWRWHRFSRAASSPSTISVIEGAEKREEPPNAQRVPFSFSRALVPEPVEHEPLLWDGED